MRMQPQASKEEEEGSQVGAGLRDSASCSHQQDSARPGPLSRHTRDLLLKCTQCPSTGLGYIHALYDVPCAGSSRGPARGRRGC